MNADPVVLVVHVQPPQALFRDRQLRRRPLVHIQRSPELVTGYRSCKPYFQEVDLVLFWPCKSLLPDVMLGGRKLTFDPQNSDPLLKVIWQKSKKNLSYFFILYSDQIRKFKGNFSTRV